MCKNRIQLLETKKWATLFQKKIFSRLPAASLVISSKDFRQPFETDSFESKGTLWTVLYVKTIFQSSRKIFCRFGKNNATCSEEPFRSQDFCFIKNWESYKILKSCQKLPFKFPDKTSLWQKMQIFSVSNDISDKTKKKRMWAKNYVWVCQNCVLRHRKNIFKERIMWELIML